MEKDTRFTCRQSKHILRVVNTSPQGSWGPNSFLAVHEETGNQIVIDESDGPFNIIE